KIDDCYYLTFTNFNGINALGSVAVSKDLLHWEIKGSVVPRISLATFKQFLGSKLHLIETYLKHNVSSGVFELENKRVLLWDKNLIFFPRRIDGKFWILHRIKPDIQVIPFLNSLEDLTIDYWKYYFSHFEDHILLSPTYRHESSYIGGGCPPIETDKGWLLIYHGVQDTKEGFVYSACAALLD